MAISPRTCLTSTEHTHVEDMRKSNLNKNFVDDKK